MKKKFDLKYRQRRFKKLFSDKCFNTIDNLIAFHKIKKDYFQLIQRNCLDYIVASFDDRSKYELQKKTNLEKLDYIKKNISKLYSMTPNGFIVPKSHSYLEYNILLKNFYNYVDKFSKNINIEYWQEPLGICIKTDYNSRKEVKKKNRFYHQTSNAHIESWAGYSNFGINTLLNVFGDITKNYTEFFNPSSSYNDKKVNLINKDNKDLILKSNFKSLPNKKILKHYVSGNLIFWENIFLHRTKITSKINTPRIFLVNQLIPKLNNIEKKNHIINKFRKINLLEHKWLINEDTILKFKKKNDKKFKSTLGGKTAPYNYEKIT